MSFFAELKRRNVFKVGVAYAIVAWLLIQVASILLPTFHTPEWVMQAFTVLLILGFPVALILAWAYELTPEGIKATTSEGPAENHTRTTGQRLNYFIISVLVLAVAFLLVDKYVVIKSPEVREQPETYAVAANSPTEKIVGNKTEQSTLSNSIAVLPFENLSPNPDDAYFAAGLHEELLNQLTKLQDLNVIARTTMRQYSNTDKSIQEIAGELNVAAVLEGSVRKADDDLRITVQLINGTDGYHIWSQTYNRKFKDIFVIQEDIARSVAGALGVELGVDGRNQFRGAGTRDVKAYDAYLEGFFEDEYRNNQENAIIHYNRAIELDPDYAAAWASLSIVTMAPSWNVEPSRAAGIQERGYQAALRAVKLDPDLAIAHAMLGTLLWIRGDWISSKEEHAKALALSANPTTFKEDAIRLIGAGQIRKAYAQFGASLQLDPLLTTSLFYIVHTLVLSGRYAEAEEEMNRDERLGITSAMFTANMRLVIALNRGKSAKIKERISNILTYSLPSSGMYSLVFKDFETPDTVLSTLNDIYTDKSQEWPDKRVDIALMAAYFKDPKLALTTMTDELLQNRLRTYYLWYPAMTEVRQLPGFKKLVKELGLVAYWHTTGDWGEFCHPIGEDDFECN